MKSLKKFLALALALALCFAMALPAMAVSTAVEAPGKKTATLTLTTPIDGHTYNVYQIFAGDVVKDAKNGDILSNVQYGVNFRDESGKAATGAVPSDVLAMYNSTDEAKAQALAKRLTAPGMNLCDPVAVLSGGDDGNNYTATLPTGYYLIVDNDDNLEDGKHPEGDAVSALMVQMLGDLTIAAKVTDTKFDKTTLGDDGETLTDAAGHEIGEVFPFYLTATVPAKNLLQYETYNLIFTDSMGNGLTFNDGFDLEVTGVDNISNNAYSVKDTADEDITVASLVNQDGVSFKLVISDLIALVGKDKVKELAAAEKNIEVKFTYRVFMNEGSKVYSVTGDGVDENKNTASLQYPRKPGGSELGKTPDEKVTLFTFDLNGNKVDENGDSMAGAGFTLYKAELNEDGSVKKDEATGLAATGTPVPIYTNEAKDRYLAWDPANSEEEVLPEGYTALDKDEIITKKLTGENKNLVIEGLKPGTYILRETTVPAGYNRANDILIKVEAEYVDDDSEEATGEKKVVLTVTKTYIKTKDLPNEKNDVKVDEENNTGLEIENKKGTLLPSTGGIGTTIFYAVGGALVVGAGILLFVKKRMGSKG